MSEPPVDGGRTGYRKPVTEMGLTQPPAWKPQWRWAALGAWELGWASALGPGLEWYRRRPLTCHHRPRRKEWSILPLQSYRPSFHRSEMVGHSQPESAVIGTTSPAAQAYQGTSPSTSSQPPGIIPGSRQYCDSISSGPASRNIFISSELPQRLACLVHRNHHSAWASKPKFA